METCQGSRSYVYTDLPHKLAFRLLDLHPAPAFDSPLEATLRQSRFRAKHLSPGVFELEEEIACVDDFEALSYSWGPSQPSAMLSLPDNTFLLIGPNLESFLRHRRHAVHTVTVWIDAVCINQSNVAELNSQVRMMHLLYKAAPRLTIWLGPASDDSDLAIDTLKSLNENRNVFMLVTRPAKRMHRAIQALLAKSWWSRSWIVQEVAQGGSEAKYPKTQLRCGNAIIAWTQLILACAVLKLNQPQWAQDYSCVNKALLLDEQCSRSPEANVRNDASTLLEDVATYRFFETADPRNKIYSMIGFRIHPRSIGGRLDMLATPYPIDYACHYSEVYIRFALYGIDRSDSLDILRHCERDHDLEDESKMPSWAPDWMARSLPEPLPSSKRKGQKTYLGANQDVLRERAQIALDTIGNSHLERDFGWRVIDDCNCSEKVVAMHTCDDSEPVLFRHPMSSGTSLACRQVSEHQADLMQKGYLKELLSADQGYRTCYKAAGQTLLAHWHILGNKAGIPREIEIPTAMFDTIAYAHAPYVDDLSDWTKSTHFLVSLAQCKQKVLDTEGPNEYGEEKARLEAFWKTIFAGQAAFDPDGYAEWLPVIPDAWEHSEPPLVPTDPLQVEYLEWEMIQFPGKGKAIVRAASPLDRIRMHTYAVSTTHPEITKPYTRDQQEEASTRSKFKELGELWKLQPYDLYHRPFELPSVVPDPYWEYRRRLDTRAQQETSEARKHKWAHSIFGDDCAETDKLQAALEAEINKTPSMVPQKVERRDLAQYALGRRFFITKQGAFALGPKHARLGDQVIIPLSLDVPLVVRRCEEKTFQVVGETYVHGIMDGELLKDLPPDGRKNGKFVPGVGLLRLK
ncbi:hypothetical protein M011DRAFT_489313 [Sporormia fimetaria CBS 119925]|uniref:Heterokaryon incompatibility domain-containing protein n=1 Tax=Sporormia fimetaria CBS 119925 TaxID=1340428 RepID=A0A6A6V1U6_9PLEO|nr:hypothetical protein M011DRAFT_489313 [Sporormia fimetaria CBS 119925]